MPDDTPPTARYDLDGEFRALADYLRQRIPDCHLTRTTLPGVPELSLYLINADYPRDNLDHDQAAALMDKPPFWGFCWASGQVLARAILDNPEWVRDRYLVDFGAGSGIVGLAAAMVGARRVVICDQDPIALRAARLNAAAAGLEVELTSSLETLLDGDPRALDMVTVADVFYDRDNLPLLDLLLERFRTVLVSDSRLGGRHLPGMDIIGRSESHTVPDLDESEAFNHVTLYQSR